jgi:hypothetical protein
MMRAIALILILAACTTTDRRVNVRGTNCEILEVNNDVVHEKVNSPIGGG